MSDSPAVSGGALPGLFLIATPIGNLDDITLRALKVLRAVDVLLAEDTRESLKLLSAHNVPPPPHGVHALHDHNEADMATKVLRWLGEGRRVGLVSDAGTPGISDPGYRLVRAARDAGLPVTPIPGACAAIAAVSASGLPTDRFSFVGFPPKKAGALDRWLDELEAAPGTLVLYAAAREVPELLEALVARRQDPEVAVYRELTKVYEECLRGPASVVLADWTKNPRRGEVTMVIGRPEAGELDDEALRVMLRKGTVDEVRTATGVSRKRLYKLKLEL